MFGHYIPTNLMTRPVNNVVVSFYTRLLPTPLLATFKKIKNLLK